MSSTRIICLSRALSPITHMAGAAGNEAIIARETVRLSDGSERRAPVLSGNALRHVSVRSPGMRWLVDEYGLASKISLAQLNYLFHGGSLTESTGREDTRRIAEMGECWPIMRLLGGCLPNQILQGSLRVSPGALCCEENRLRLESILGEESLTNLGPFLSAESFVRPYRYSTFDALGREPELAAMVTDDPDAKSDPRMLYTGEAVQPGAYFAHDYTLLDPTTVEVGCILWSLNLWQKAGGVVGGMGAKGHGRLTTRIVLDDDYDPATCVADYLRRAREMKDRAIAWLHAAFAKAEKKPKGKGKAKKDAPTEEAPAQEAFAE